MVKRRLPLEETVLATLRPTQAEKDHVCGIARRVLGLIRQSGKAEGMVVGSVARHTWVRGDRDLDVFMLFDPSLPREELENQGLSLARGIAAALTEKYHEKYAEHPYISATIDDVDVDLVPCYKVDSATRIQSAVDRTPFHTRYITEKINGMIDDVLLLKRFTKAGGIYGSDQMTEGFSGYLCELLILHYGGFTQLLKAAAEWKPQMIIDMEDHVAKEFDEPLVMIDPVDPKRNVAAAVSLDRMAEFVELARGYLESPAESFFGLPEARSMTSEELADLLEHRGTTVYAITFPTPPYIEEIVVPQLKRSTGSVCEHLERNGFSVHHAHYRMEREQCMILVELLVAELPAIRNHTGPRSGTGSMRKNSGPSTVALPSRGRSSMTAGMQRKCSASSGTPGTCSGPKCSCRSASGDTSASPWKTAGRCTKAGSAGARYSRHLLPGFSTVVHRLCATKKVLERQVRGGVFSRYTAKNHGFPDNPFPT